MTHCPSPVPHGEAYPHRKLMAKMYASLGTPALHLERMILAQNRSSSLHEPTNIDLRFPLTDLLEPPPIQSPSAISTKGLIPWQAGARLKWPIFATFENANCAFSILHMAKHYHFSADKCLSGSRHVHCICRAGDCFLRFKRPGIDAATGITGRFQNGRHLRRNSRVTRPSHHRSWVARRTI